MHSVTARHYIIATAGHVDHGKSALVKALTGTDPDRLPEERARQITIDLGFAELNLGQGIHAGIVDVPGHEDFVRNMIAGVGSIDLALLVVAADDGWMPQTEEHLQILTYLGVQRAVIALTKSDLGNIDSVAGQIREQLHGTALAQSAIIPTSVRTDEGIEDLRSALAVELAGMQPQRDIGKPRLSIDRVFTLHGIGTVVTGTLTGGTLRRGDAVVVQPRNFAARIRSIQTHGEDVDLAGPGMRTALNLPDVAVGEQVVRGDVVAIEGFEPTATLDVVLSRSPRLRRAAPLKSGASAYLHHGTSRVPAKVIFLDREALPGGENALAQLRLGSPVLTFLGDQFVLRDPSEQHTIAGGVVLDPDGDERKFRSDAQRELLTARATAFEDVDTCLETEIARRGAIVSENLLGRSHFSAGEVGAALTRLQQRGKIFSNGKIAADIGVWQELRDRVLAFVQAEHQTYPERVGMELSDLRAKLPGLSQEAFDALLVDLACKDIARVGSAIALRTHSPALPPALKNAAQEIVASLSVKPFDPPNQKQDDPESRKAMKFLIEQGEIVELVPETFLTRSAFAQMKSAISRFISGQGAATVSQLRQELQTSRRIIVPLLELLDRDGVTRRVGDKRRLL